MACGVTCVCDQIEPFVLAQYITVRCPGSGGLILNDMKYQYFSKWRNEWIDFNPTEGQLIQLKLYHYQVRQILF